MNKKIPSKRKDCYFGLHFDFHATEEIEPLGITDREKFCKYLDDVKPDFIQVDTKGHPGYASYFSKYGTVDKGLKIDQLKMFREETKKRGIYLYAHYSGVRDVKACKDHGWAIIERYGEPWLDGTDLTSPYVDEIMIPQLLELAGDYGLDGAWIDGEVWATEMNFKKEVVDEFLKETGYSEISKDPSHPSHIAFKQKFRKQFYDYVKHYTQAVHEKYPDFEITSNYACSDQNAEMVLIDDLDYLSGDFANDYTARLSVRCYSGVDKVWDLMSWGSCGAFLTPKVGFMSATNKHLKRLYRECAMVISAGGGYHIVNNMTRQGEIRDTERENMVKLAKFARDRQPFCERGMVLNSTAVWYSDYDISRKRAYKTFGPSYEKGAILDMVLDGGRPASFIYDEALLTDKINDFSSIIVPDNKFISNEHKNALIKYVKNGGKLIVCGQEACKALVEIEKEYTEPKIFYYSNGVYMAGVQEKIVTFGSDFTPLFHCYEDYMKRDMPTINAAAYKKLGKGEIYCFGWDVCSNYNKLKDYSLRDVFRSVLDKADPEPLVYLESGIRRVEVIPTIKGGEFMAHAINITERLATGNLDDFPPIYDITIAIKCDKAPVKIMEQPYNREVPFTYDGKYAHAFIKELDVHTILIPKY